MDRHIKKANETDLLTELKEVDLNEIINEIKLIIDSLGFKDAYHRLNVLNKVTLPELSSNFSLANDLVLFAEPLVKNSSSESLLEWVSLNSKVIMLAR